MVSHPTAPQGIRIPWTDLRALERVLARNRHILSPWAPAVNDPRALEIADGTSKGTPADWKVGSCRKCSGRALLGRNDTWVEGLLLRTCVPSAHR